MVKLYLARHGETSANEQGVYYGRLDAPLTEVGIQQSRSLARTLAGVAFDRVIVSGLRRTRQTAEIIVSKDSISLEADPQFNELDFGDWEGRHYSDLATKDSERYQAWCADWINQSPPNGESFVQFKNRVENAFKRLIERYSDETILFVGHQGVLRVIMLLLLKTPEAGFWQFTFEHGAYSLIEIEQDHAVIRRINAKPQPEPIIT